MSQSLKSGDDESEIIPEANERGMISKCPWEFKVGAVCIVTMILIAILSFFILLSTHKLTVVELQEDSIYSDLYMTI